MRLALLFLLLLASATHGQTITVGDAIPSTEVDAARRTLENSQPKVLKLAVNEFEIIEPAKTVTQSLLWLSTNDATIQKIEIPAGQAFSIFGIRRGEKVAKHHVFQAKTYAWTVIFGVATGQNTITLIKSGAKPELPPVIVDTISITVGNPAPVPVDPVEPIPTPTDALVQAAQADIKAGKGIADDVSNYAAIYSMYASQIRNGNTLVTVGDLYKEMNASIDRLLGEDIDKTLPSLRRAVGKELSAKIPTNAALRIADYRAVIADEFASIAKRLQGVK